MRGPRFAAGILGASLLFVAVAVVQTFPVLLTASSAIPGASAGDNVTFLWDLWWARVYDGFGGSLFQTPLLMHPYGVPLVLHTLVPLPGLIGRTALAALSLPSVYNATVLYAYALNGLLACLLAHRLTRNWRAAVLAGLVFETAPYFSGHVVGHLNLLHAWVLPAGAIACLSLLDGRRWVGMLGLATAVAAAAYTDYYLLVFLLVLIACLVAGAWWTWDVRIGPRRPLRVPDHVVLGLCVLAAALAVAVSITGGVVADVGGVRVSATSGLNLRTLAWLFAFVLVWRRWRPRLRVQVADQRRVRGDVVTLAGAAVLSVVAVLPLAVQFLHLAADGAYISPAVRWRSGPMGIDPATMLLGNPFHPLWPAWARAAFDAFGDDVVERTAWLGIVPLVLVPWGWRRHAGDRTFRQWATILVLFFVWSCGAYLVLFGTNSGLWMPGALAQYVPVVSNARIMSRAVVVVHLAAAVLVALIVASSDRLGRWSWAIMLVVALDSLAAPVPVTTLQVPDLYRELRTMPAGAVLEVPSGYRDGFGARGDLDPRALLYQTVHGRPLVGGFVARLPPAIRSGYEDNPAFRRLLDLSEGTAVGDLSGTCETAGFEDLGVRYVVVDTARAGRTLQDYVSRCLPIERVRVDGPLVLYVHR